MREKAFINHTNNGFVLNLLNGIRISTLFGYSDYCENYTWGKKGLFINRFDRIPEGSSTCEIMVKCPDQKWLDKFNRKYGDGDIVIGHSTIDEWLKILDVCRKWKPKKYKKYE